MDSGPRMEDLRAHQVAVKGKTAISSCRETRASIVVEELAGNLTDKKKKET